MPLIPKKTEFQKDGEIFWLERSVDKLADGVQNLAIENERIFDLGQAVEELSKEIGKLRNSIKELIEEMRTKRGEERYAED